MLWKMFDEMADKPDSVVPSHVDIVDKRVWKEWSLKFKKQGSYQQKWFKCSNILWYSVFCSLVKFSEKVKCE